MARRRDAEETLPLDFESRDRERYAMLRCLQLGRSSTASHVRFLLEIVAGVAGDGELTWSYARLAERMCLPERTLKRVVAAAESAGLLLVRRSRRPDGTAGTNAIAIDWARIAARTYDPIGHRRPVGPSSAKAQRERPSPLAGAPAGPASAPAAEADVAAPGRSRPLPDSFPERAQTEDPCKAQECRERPSPLAGAPAGSASAPAAETDVAAPGRSRPLSNSTPKTAGQKDPPAAAARPPNATGGQYGPWTLSPGANMAPPDRPIWPRQRGQYGPAIGAIRSLKGSPPPPPSCCSANKGPEEGGKVVEVVVERLHGLGMADARSAVERAIANGAPPALLSGLIDHYESRPGAWGLGALHYRIRQASPGQAIESLWPPPAHASSDSSREDEHRQVRTIRYLAFREGRRRGWSDEQIEEAIRRECRRRGLSGGCSDDGQAQILAKGDERNGEQT